MYTGTLIGELIETVERAGEQSLERAQEEKLAHWYAVSQQELRQLDSSLAGVA
jgi:hypothetical protein